MGGVVVGGVVGCIMVGGMVVAGLAAVVTWWEVSCGGWSYRVWFLRLRCEV